MSALQWALLILSVVIVVAVVVISRRDHDADPLPRRAAKPRPADAEAPPSRTSAEPVREQLDIFDDAPVDDIGPAESVSEPRPARRSEPARDAAPLLRPSIKPVAAEPTSPSAAPASIVDPTLDPLTGKQYDEFGVGRPRRRTAPLLDATPSGADPAAAAPANESTPSDVAPPVSVPAWVRSAPSATPAAAGTAAPLPPPVEQKIVALLIVERNGGVITGNKLHSALAAQGLVFGAKQIYHRLARNESVFAVASLTKPGVLLPAEATQFSTPGLSAFMVLPGPVKPLNALHDMLATTQALARALNAEVYDSKKQPLSSETMRALQADVEAWARAAQI